MNKINIGSNLKFGYIFFSHETN